MKKKMLLSLLLLLFASLLMSACTGGATGDTGGGEEEGGVSGTVVLWHAYKTGSAEEDTLTQLVENAKTEFPDLTTEVLQIPFEQIFNKYQTEVAAGGGPDMFVAPNDDLGNWARGGLVEDLDEELAGRLDGVSQTGVDGMKVGGVLYGVPESAKAVALYYNTSLVETPPATTDELLAAVEGGAPTTFFIGAYHMFGWAGAFGGQLMDDSGKCVADQGGWAEALEYLVALKGAGAVMTNDYGAAEAPFRAGETAFFVNGPWALGDYKKDLGENLGVVKMPSGPGGDAKPLNGIDGFYLNPNGTNKSAAVELALFLSSGESAQLYTDSAGHVPIRDSVNASDPLVAAFAEASASGFPRPQSTEFAAYWSALGDTLFVNVIDGGADATEAVAEACAAMNETNGK